MTAVHFTESVVSEWQTVII